MMQNLSPEPRVSQPRADITQFMIVCAIAMLIGVTLPARGTFSLLSFALSTFIKSATDVVFVLLPVVAGVGVLGSIGAYVLRHRALGLLTIGSGLYVFWFGDQCLRMYAWDDPPEIGAAAIFFGALCLAIASIIYLFRPGERPAQISFFGTSVRWQQLRIVAGILHIASIVAYQQHLPQLGSWLLVAGLGSALAALLLFLRKA